MKISGGWMAGTDGEVDTFEGTAPAVLPGGWLIGGDGDGLEEPAEEGGIALAVHQVFLAGRVFRSFRICDF